MKRLLLFLLPILAIVSCSKADSGGGDGFIGDFAFGSSSTSYVVSTSAQEISIPIVTELTTSDWSVESDASWCTVTKFNSVLLAYVTANTATDIRKANIVVTVGSDTYDVDIIQICTVGSSSTIPSDINTTTFNNSLLEVFTDISCSEVLSSATEEDIDALPTYYKTIAYYLKYGFYESEFRIGDYTAISDPEEWSSILITKKYSIYGNPTGVYANAGDEVIVLVGDTHGYSINMYCVYFSTSNVGTVTHKLVEGTNKITMTQSGLLFVDYTVSDIQASTAQPIRVHIPNNSGVVDGYFDSETMDDAKYAELVDKASFSHFIVKGRNVIQAFDPVYYRMFAPDKISENIDTWDQIADYQFELMGIEDIRGVEMNNYIFAFSFTDTTYYMWANDYRVGFRYDTLYMLVDSDVFVGEQDCTWGPTHELGHVNQGAINWGGCTESSNNLFSNYVRYKNGISSSRGSEIWQLADRRLNDYAWCNLDGSGGEDMDLHMRMNWQLWIYYHRCGVKPTFWPELFAELRDNPLSSNAGQAQLDFAMAASKVAGENLYDFFETWGFFRECDREYVYDYANYYVTVTASMIAEAKAFMEQYPDTQPFQYIEDRYTGQVDTESFLLGDVGYYTTFKSNTKISTDVNYTLSANTISISGGSEAVAFEVRRDNDNERLYFFNYLNYEIPAEVNLTGASFYAVQADGERILMNQI